jgi:hypothetical protein
MLVYAEEMLWVRVRVRVRVMHRAIFRFIFRVRIRIRVGVRGRGNYLHRFIRKNWVYFTLSKVNIFP